MKIKEMSWGSLASWLPDLIYRRRKRNWSAVVIQFAAFRNVPWDLVERISCADTHAEMIYEILVLDALSQLRDGRRRVLAELAQRGRGKLAHQTLAVLEALG